MAYTDEFPVPAASVTSRPRDGHTEHPALRKDRGRSLFWSDGPIDVAMTYGEIKGAYLIFQKDADQTLPGWKEKLTCTDEFPVQAASSDRAKQASSAALEGASVEEGSVASQALDQSSRHADPSLDEATLIGIGKSALVAHIVDVCGMMCSFPTLAIGNNQGMGEVECGKHYASCMPPAEVNLTNVTADDSYALFDRGRAAGDLSEMITQLADVDVPVPGGLSIGPPFQDLSVPGGFSIMSHACKQFLDKGGISEFVKDEPADDSIYEGVDEFMRVGTEISDKIMVPPVMITQLADVSVPATSGFSITAHAYKEFLDKGGMKTILNYDTLAADTKALVDVHMKGYLSRKEFIKPTPYIINLRGILFPNLFWSHEDGAQFGRVRDIYAPEFQIFMEPLWSFSCIFSGSVSMYHQGGIQPDCHALRTQLAAAISGLLRTGMKVTTPIISDGMNVLDLPSFFENLRRSDVILTTTGEAAHFAAESSTGTNVNGCTTDDSFVVALVYYIDPDSDEMKTAYPNLLFDRNTTDGRGMMRSFQILAVCNNQGPGDVEYAKSYKFYMPPEFLRLYDGPAVNVMDMWRIRGMGVQHGGFVVGTIIKPRLGLQPKTLGEACYAFWQGSDFTKNDESQGHQVLRQMNECIPEVVRAMRATIKETGNDKLFLANITAEDPCEMTASGKYCSSQFGPLLENRAFLVDGQVAGGTAMSCACRYSPEQFLYCHLAGLGSGLKIYDLYVPPAFLRLYGVPVVSLEAVWHIPDKGTLNGDFGEGITVKSKLGTPPRPFGEACYASWRVGDFIKYDERPGHQVFCHQNEFIPEDVKAMRAAIGATGNGRLFLAHTAVDDPNEMIALGMCYLSQLGPLLANCAFLADGYVTGGTAETYARRSFPQQNTRAQQGYTAFVHTKTSQVVGVSAIHTGTMRSGKMEGDAADKSTAFMLQAAVADGPYCRQEWEGMKLTAPIISGSMNVLYQPSLFENMGHFSAILATRGEAAHFAAETSMGTNATVCTTDDSLADALVYCIGPDSEEMKIAFPNLLFVKFDHNFTHGRGMLCSFLIPAASINQGRSDVEYGTIYNSYLSPAFLRLYDGPVVNVVDIWRILGEGTQVSTKET